MIDGIGGRGIIPPTRSATPASTTAPAAKIDAVKPNVSTFGSAAREMAASPPVDTAKVDRLRNAIASGAYPVDPARIAERMIALDLPRRG